jgi:hypothetical protein
MSSPADVKVTSATASPLVRVGAKLATQQMHYLNEFREEIQRDIEKSQRRTRALEDLRANKRNNVELVTLPLATILSVLLPLIGVPVMWVTPTILIPNLALLSVKYIKRF